ncbi:hypothetical protein J5868_01170 [Candidatus Saccharibacteria bacterium]|nr:hypothetical protein [Candidatus Saccharibacteria bacterium]
MKNKKNNKKLAVSFDKDERVFLSTPPGKIAVIAWLISVVCLLGWWIFDILISSKVLVGDEWKVFVDVLDMIAWPCLAIACSIFFTAMYFINHKKK